MAAPKNSTVRQVAAAALIETGSLATPDGLPIGERREELLDTIRNHQVVIVAGETGSGKSTQLPKLCIEAGRGVDGIIGHTQPRRVAARTVAKRIADETGTELGQEIGFTVRFADRVAESTLVRVMTDGVLLAEIQRDRTLARYDTIIVDEAHERSLNIDFLLGYLARLLPERPDLKVIVTSATIDTARFARHFARDGVDAPVITVEGRTYPVEIRFRPFGADALAAADADDQVDDQRDQVQATLDAVDELCAAGPGDILVFVSGEREIHDTADALKGHDDRLEVLPLYARLSFSEQQRVFEPHRGRRVVLSTNVAETSLTVPGVRYVIDAGNARISRYSRRLKVQQLPIEPISRASANQRAGRCGRVAPGICIRLYSEEDFEARPAFTEPEILRTNLASVICQMTAIGLGDIAAFEFVEPPAAAMIRDGYVLLEELGAITETDDAGMRDLTPVGRQLARMPIDPRLGRMVIEANRRNCVHDVMVIAAALSIQDPRERPLEKRQAADEQHVRFKVPGSDLMSYVALWNHLRDQQRTLSSNQFRKQCKAQFLNYLRVREWQDLFSQLRRAAGSVGIKADTTPGQADDIHRALLAGLLSHIGMIEPEGRGYRGARGTKFNVGRESSVAKRRPRWVMAAELVDTGQIWARGVAEFDPAWAEAAGAHVVKRSIGDPFWDPKQAVAVAPETVTLYGLPIVAGRHIPYADIDPLVARDLFVEHALVRGEWTARHRFIKHNEQFLTRVAEMRVRVRREDLLDDSDIAEFFESRVPEHVVSGRAFDKWWRRKRASRPDLLNFSDDLVFEGHARVRLRDYPDVWKHYDATFTLTYRHDPGGPLDGVNVHIPISALNQVTSDGFDWHIPGHRYELVAAMIRSLNKDLRRQLVPMSDTIDDVFDRVKATGANEDGRPPLAEALAQALRAARDVNVSSGDFDASRVDAYLRMNLIVVDTDGTAIDVDTDPDVLRARQAKRLRAAVAEASTLSERSGMVTWDVGTLPEMIEVPQADHVVRGFPALVDDGDSVSLRILSNERIQHRSMRGGVRRLLQLTTAPSRKTIISAIDRNHRLAVAGHPMTFDQLVDDCIAAATDNVVIESDLPWDEASFETLQTTASKQVAPIAARALQTAAQMLRAASVVRHKLDSLTADTMEPSVKDARQQLDRLVRRGFVRSAGVKRMDDLVRYVNGVQYRVDRLATDLARDQRRMAEVRPLERRYAVLVNLLPLDDITSEMVELGWQFEELRVSVFAQPIGARSGISAKRIAKELDAFGA